MTLTLKPRNRTFGWADYAGVFAILGLLVARYVPVAYLPFWGCSFRRMTGWPCPGCGLTRVADYFAHFHFYEAFKANPLGFVGALLSVFFAIYFIVHMIFKTETPAIELSSKDLVLLRNTSIALLALNYIFVILQHKFKVLS